MYIIGVLLSSRAFLAMPCSLCVGIPLLRRVVCGNDVAHVLWAWGPWSTAASRGTVDIA